MSALDADSGSGSESGRDVSESCVDACVAVVSVSLDTLGNGDDGSDADSVRAAAGRSEEVESERDTVRWRFGHRVVDDAKLHE